MEKDDFLIPVNGLASGKTLYRWTAGREFFEEFGNSDILDASVEVEAQVDKAGHQIGVDYHIRGAVTVPCDRCLASLSVPVDSAGKLDVKARGGEDEETSQGEDGRETVYLSGNGAELDMRQIVYDYVCLSLPVTRVHAEGECDPDVVRYLGTHQEDGDSGSGETPFSALKDIFRN